MNRRKKTVVITIIMAAFLAAVYIAGVLIPDSAVAPDFNATKITPCLQHLFGTDMLGRDLFLRTVKGLSVSMSVGIAASAASAVIAVIVGAAAASGSKTFDRIVNWIIDLVMSVPHTILIILISFALGRGMKGLMVGIIVTHWTSLARLMRAEVLQLKSAQFVAVSKKLGHSGLWILTRHMLPHLVPQFIAGMILLFPHAILHEASVSFLGFGLPPEQPAVGIILSESMKYLSAGVWWSAVFPGAVLVLIVLLIDRLGENVKKIMDPYSSGE